ncbi:MAG: hypothetical protein CMP77_06900 [Flavobacterium sp.]|nr:hypothetical protein [Flavobacterium sp.]
MHNQMKLLITITLWSLATISAIAQAHKDEPRHGGTVEESGDYHFEIVQSASQLTIYLLEAEDTPSLQYSGIEAEFIFSKKSSEKAFLLKSDKGYFVTTIPSSGTYEHCILVLDIKGERLSVTFSNPSHNHSRKKKHGHSH